MIRYTRSRSRVLSSLGMPFFMLAIVGSGLNGVLSIPGSSGDYMDFMAPGIIAMVVLFTSIFSGVMVIMDRQFGFLKETLVAPVSRTHIVIGKALGGATTACVQALIMLGIAVLLGVHVDPAVLPALVAAMLLVSLSFVSLGIAIASVMEDIHGFQLVMNFLVMPLFFLSGAIFPLGSAPDIIRLISFLDPLTYAVEAFRFLLIGHSGIPVETSFGLLGLFFIVCSALAVVLFGRIED